MSLITTILGKLQAGSLAPLWHRFAPSITLSRKFKGLRLYFDSRDNAAALVVPASMLEQREWPLLELPKHIDGPVWDIGANVGYLTLTAAGLGRKTTAFEMSARAAALLVRSREANGLNFEVVPRGFALEEKSYHAPGTSHPGNQIEFSDDGSERTITYAEAEKSYGTPALIKMDIEGMEKGFFESPGFKAWIVEKEIIFVVEVHTRLLGFTPVWEDVPHVQLPSTHFLYCANKAKLNRLLETLAVKARV